MACVQEHETACAEENFRQALAIRDSPAIRYNLASALFELRRYPEAARLTASVLANDAAPADIREHARELAQQISEQGGTLRIELDGDAAGATVRVDDDPIPAEQLAAVAVAPGSRAVAALRGDAVVARERAQVARGETATVRLTIPPDPALLAEQAAPIDAEPPASVPLHEDWRFWTPVGVGTAAAIAVIVTVAVVAGGGGSVGTPIEGNYTPGVLRWE